MDKKILSDICQLSALIIKQNTLPLIISIHNQKYIRTIYSTIVNKMYEFIAVGGHSTFFALLNTFVHVVMYFYYMVAAMGPKYQKYIWWKKYLTAFQMVSKCFIIVLGHIILTTDVSPYIKL